MKKPKALTELEYQLIQRVEKSESLSQTALEEIRDTQKDLEQCLGEFMNIFRSVVKQFQADRSQMLSAESQASIRHLNRAEELYRAAEALMQDGAESLEKALESYSRTETVVIKMQNQINEQRIEVQTLKSLCNKTLRRQTHWETQSKEIYDSLMQQLRLIQDLLPPA